MAVPTTTTTTTTKGRRLIRRRKPRSSSGVGVLLGFFARLLSWYILYNAVFQCPSEPSLDDPLICKGVASIRETATPYIQPYYDEYAAEYVDKIAPYAIYTQTHIILPAIEKGKEGFDKYGKPQVEKLQKLAEPTLTWYAREYKRIYSTYLEKHTEKAIDFAEEFHRGLLEFNERTVVPTYRYAAPHAQRAFYASKEYSIRYLIPQAKYTAAKAWSFIYQFVWSPSVKFWREYVEVQIGRIGQRFTDKFSDGEGAAVDGQKKLSSISSKVAATASSIFSSDPKPAQITSSLLSKASEGTAETSAPARNSKGYTKEEERAIIADDLKSWRAKFESAAEKATKDLTSEIDKIVTSAHSEKKDEVKSLFSNLDSLISGQIAKLKATIVELARHHDTGPDAEQNRKARDTAFERLYIATREAGTSIRDKIIQIRNQREEFANRVLDEVSAVTESHIEVLNSVIDMGAQELGMKWAWKLDSVTYKDWKKYHDLKKDFQDVRTPLTEAAETNEKLIELSDWIAEWEEMAVAKAKFAADELARLKNIGKKKIEGKDWSEKFEGEGYEPSSRQATKASDSAQKPLIRVGGNNVQTKPAAKVIVGGASAGEVKNKQKVAYEVEDEDAIIDRLQDVAGKGLDYLDDASKAVSQALYGTKTAQDNVEKFTSIASEQYESALAAASKALWGTATPTPEAVASIASAKFADAVSAASIAIYGTPDPTLVSVVSVVSDSLETAAAIAASQASELASHASEHAVSAVSQAGEYAASVTDTAALQAQQVRSLVQELIYGREPAFTESVMSRFSIAMYGTQPGYVEQATAAAADVFATATSAIEALVTPPPAVVAALSAANSQFQEIVNQASEAVYGPPEKGSVEKAQDAVNSAASDVSSRISVALYGTQTAAYESATLKLAAAASSARAALSEAVYGTQKGAVEQATEAVAVKMAKASAILASQYSAAQEYASRAIYGEPQSHLENSYAQLSAELERYHVQLSEAIYGTPEGTFAKATRVAGEKASEASAIAAERIAQASLAAESAVREASRALESAKAEASRIMKAEKDAKETKGMGESIVSVVGEKVAEATERVKEKVEVVRDEL